jgi:hypothetical protein
MADFVHIFKRILTDAPLFAEHASGTRLRSYQKQVALAIADSVINNRGLTFVVIFPRQSGKNELQAQIETYLLSLLQTKSAEIVKVSPTWKPQSQNAMRRLERVLSRNLITRGAWSKESGYIYRIGQARIYFLSAAPSSNIVGATASTLLECDEAQDVDIAKFDKEINPMAASTNATKVFWGTAWTSQTLLAREKRAAQEAEKLDHIKRVFQIDANQVAKEVPAYGKFVQAERLKLGRYHPFIKTQFFSEEIDEQSGMFPASRLSLMRGSHPAICAPKTGHIYAISVDVGGEDRDETLSFTGEVQGHDSTALTVFEIDLSGLTDPIFSAPRFLTVYRRTWTGATHTHLYAEILNICQLWQPHRIVIDATGIGEPLASFIEKAFPGLVIPFKFTQTSKSDLAWQWIAAIETGRYKEHAPTICPSVEYDPAILLPPLAGRGRGEVSPPTDQTVLRLQELFYEQCKQTTLEILPGPGRVARWSVPDSARHPLSGKPLHDDLVCSAALVAALFTLSWGLTESIVIKPSDLMKELTY